MLVIRGEAGIGKTALLHYCARQAAGCRVAQLSGVESELELPLAALHQLCAPMLGDLATLPEPQQDAVRVAFGLATGSVPDRFLVGLAVLGLLAEAASRRPVVCLVDDAQWLDVASSQVLEFVGRRLLAESVGILFAVREPADERLFRGMPDLPLDGLTGDDAQALLAAAVPGHLDEQVRDRLVAETRGNPLALLELVNRMSTAELAGGFAAPPTGHLHDHYLRHVRALPMPTQRLMLLAAADPTGDATLVWRAARTLGVGRPEAAAAASEQLLEIGARVRFRHPLVRSAAYAAGSPQDRCSAHRALAEATDGRADPEHRVWHLAAAATGPDEDVASQLERTAGRAQARAGLAGAAAFLQRSVALTAAPERRAERALAAAHAHLQAGSFEAALGLLAEAEAAAVDELQRARAEQLRGQVARVSDYGREAPIRLLRAAARLESLDLRPRRPDLRRGLCPVGPSRHRSGRRALGFRQLGCDERPYNPLLSALPPMIHLPAAGPDSQADWLGTMLKIAAAESGSARPGAENIRERLSELMFVETIRRYIETLTPAETGWLAGLRDPVVGQALAALHGAPRESWTVEALARNVGVSRSVLAERFTAMVGQPPMQYLALWRMQLASRLLIEGGQVAAVSAAAGYGSEAAFSRAFKKLVGQAPAAWRRGARSS